MIRRTYSIEYRQDLAMVHMAAQHQHTLDKRVTVSSVLREIIDAGLPLVRQRYEELARANVGKRREVTSLEERDA